MRFLQGMPARGRGKRKSQERRAQGAHGAQGRSATAVDVSEDVVHSLSVGGVTVRLYAEGTSECD